MAEFVQLNLCQIRDELAQIPELTGEEKRTIYKRHTKFEYRIRKRRKNEQDFLQYIKYEQDLLKLLKMRKRGSQSKKRPEVPFIMRIHNLYQLCETRFPQNVDVWISHIDFSTQHKEYSKVSRLYQQMLRTHSDEPELWIKAAKWEIDQSNIDAARALMQRCINNNKTSRLAWVEYYKLEIELDKLEEKPTGKIALVVAEHAVQELSDDAQLLVDLIGVAQKYSFMRNHVEEMLQKLRENFTHLPFVWDFLARRLLPTKQKKMSQLFEDQEERFFTVYQQAVDEVPTTEMWTLYLKACLQLVTVKAPSQDRVQKRVERTLEVFKSASDVDCLSVDMFQAWVFLMKDLLRMDAALEVCEKMVKRFSTSAAAWTQRLVLMFQTLAAPSDVIFCLNKALLSVPEKESWCLWEPVLHYVATSSYDQQEFQALLERACQRIVGEVCMPAKLYYLRWTALTKSIKAARDLYMRFSALKPVPLEFYLEYAKQERMRDKVNMKKVRRAYEDAISDYGQSDPGAWLSYIHMEMTEPDGDPAQASELHHRAKLNLPEGPLRDAFTQRYAKVVTV